MKTLFSSLIVTRNFVSFWKSFKCFPFSFLPVFFKIISQPFVLSSSFQLDLSAFPISQHYLIPGNSPQSVSTSFISFILPSVIFFLSLSLLQPPTPLFPLPLYSQGRPWPHSFISFQATGSSNYSTCSALSSIMYLCLHSVSMSTPKPFLFCASHPFWSFFSRLPKEGDW